MDAGRNHPVTSSLPVVLYENETSRIGLPTIEEINALPEKFRQYIHDLETRCDKICDVQTIALLREDGMRCSVAWKSWRPSWIGSAESFSLCGQTSPQSVAATRVTIVR